MTTKTRKPRARRLLSSGVNPPGAAALPRAGTPLPPNHRIDHPLATSLRVTANGEEIVKAASLRHSEPCPRCEGTMTEEDIQIITDETGVHAAMTCPHCGECRSKQLRVWSVEERESRKRKGAASAS